MPLEETLGRGPHWKMLCSVHHQTLPAATHTAGAWPAEAGPLKEAAGRRTMGEPERGALLSCSGPSAPSTDKV